MNARVALLVVLIVLLIVAMWLLVDIFAGLGVTV
jgi:hypothetical protein